jgi:cytochrome c oxidase subunit II
MHDLVSDQHALFPAGAQAAHIAKLWDFYFVTSVVVCALVCGAVLLAVVRRRESLRRAPTAPTLTPDATQRAAVSNAIDPAAESRRKRRVIASTVATAIALIVLLAESVLTGSALDALKTDGAVHVELVGRQWWWSVRYLDDTPAGTFVTANELHIPVGVPVVLHLSAADVIHSFWAPNLHGKRDLIPGHDTSVSLRADRPGRYRTQCAEFCGIAHAEMALWIVAEAPAAFEAWKQRQRTAAAAPSTAEQRRGQERFMTGQCVVCHAISGTDARAGVGPDLSHVASRLSLAAATIPNTHAHLTRWIADSQAIKPGNRMPPVALAPDELRDLVAYLEALQ